MGSGDGEVLVVAFDRQSREWLLGDAAQKRWARILASRGNAALPVYGMDEVDDRTKAPTLFVRDGLLVVPDVLCLNPKAGNTWHEVKAKHVPGWYRKRGRWEHGTDWTLVREYEEVERVTGVPVWLIVYEERSPVDGERESALVESGVYLGIRLAEAVTAGEHRPTWPGGTVAPHNRGRRGGGGLLWPRSAMRLLGREPWRQTALAFMDAERA